MKRMLTIIAICYSIYAVAIITFIFSRITAILHLIAFDPVYDSPSLSQYMPVIAVGLIGILLFLSTVLLSILLIRRKKRILCLVLACIFLVEIPFGTILGIFTIIILTSPAIKQEFTK